MKIGLLGYGVVGSGLVNMIENDPKKRDIQIEGILVKNKGKHMNKKHYDKITDDIEEIFNKDIDTLVELIGDEECAYKYIKRALINKMNVVTANKAVIADYGDELVALADKNNVSLKFEASVAGGIPIIKTITEALDGNSIHSINAILNGTTNFILSKMHNEDLKYQDALRKAQEIGFAEADPSADVLGYDAARKLAILSGLVYGKRVYWKDLYIEGINRIEKSDIECAEKLNCKVKMICHSEKKAGKISGYVRPALVDNTNVISNIADENNIVEVFGNAVGKMSLVGKGAGSFATGSAVFSDLTDILENPVKNLTELVSPLAELYPSTMIKEDIMVRYVDANSERLQAILKEEGLDYDIVKESISELVVFIRSTTEKELDLIDKKAEALGISEDSVRIIKAV